MTSDRRAADGPDRLKLIIAAVAVAGLLIAGAMTAFLDNPVITLVVMYCIAYGAAIIALEEDAFSNTVRVATVTFAALIVFLCTLSPIPNSPIQGLPMTDRLNYYYVYYVGVNLAGVQENIEGGYLFLMSIFRRLMPFEFYLALAAMFVLVSLLAFARAAGQNRIVALVALTFLSYFTFWSGALNVTRQFIAAGVGIWSAIILIAPGNLKPVRRILLSLGVIAAAISIHSSAFVFAGYVAFYLFRRYGNYLLMTIWAGNIFVFILNYVNVGPLTLIPGISDRLSRYDSKQISDAGLAEFQNAGVSTGNRLDWAIALLIPVLLYAAIAYYRRRDAAEDSHNGQRLFDIALLYSSLCIPFYLLSFLVFGDRLAFNAFLLIPVLTMALVVDLRSRELRYSALASIGLVCVLQMMFGIYGYTPKYWLVGLA